MPKLTIKERGSAKEWNHECDEPIISIGRLPDNLIQLTSDGVSRRHAKIVLDGENFFLIDTKSGNGTYLNGMRIQPEEKNLLRSGDIIVIDEFDMEFHDGANVIKEGLNEEVTDSDILEVKLLKKVLTALDKDMVPSIEVLNGSAEGKKVFFTDEINEIVIGRDPECSFPINEYVISRRHAKISKRWGGIIIRDMESKNGTFVNNRRVVEEYLHDGDRIALGTIVFLFRNPQEINFANLDEIKPKHRPQAKTQDIQDIVDSAHTEGETPPEGLPKSNAEEAASVENQEGGSENTGEASEHSAIEDWDKLERDIGAITNYPNPTKNKKVRTLNFVEMSMIGLGAVVFLFAVITIINLILS